MLTSQWQGLTRFFLGSSQQLPGEYGGVLEQSATGREVKGRAAADVPSDRERLSPEQLTLARYRAVRSFVPSRERRSASESRSSIWPKTLLPANPCLPSYPRRTAWNSSGVTPVLKKNRAGSMPRPNLRMSRGVRRSVLQRASEQCQVSVVQSPGRLGGLRAKVVF